MSTRAYAVFARDMKDGTSEVFGAFYSRDDGGPNMLFGSQLSSALCLRGREAKVPDSAFALKHGTRRCGSVFTGAGLDAGEEALGAMALLKSFMPYYGRRTDSIIPFAGAFAPGRGTPEDRTAAFFQQDGASRLNEAPDWIYAVRWKEEEDEAGRLHDRPEPVIQVFSARDGFAERFRGTPREFRRKFRLGAPQSLHALWTEAASCGIPLGSIPAREMAPDLCLAAVEGDPMNIADVPQHLLSPEVCRACGEALASPYAAIRGKPEDAAAAVSALLETKGASAEARAAFTGAFEQAMGNCEESAEEAGPRP